MAAPCAHAAPQPAAGRTGFDHLLHARQLATAGAAAPPCARCHPLATSRKSAGELAGRPGHAACYGDCHGPTPTRAEALALLARPAAPPAPGAAAPTGPARHRTCAVCHGEAELRGPRTDPAYPPYQLDPDWGLELSHQRHRAAPCLTCHRLPEQRAKGPAPRAHQRCAGCHDGAPAAGKALAFAMTACEQCHFPAVGPLRKPALARSKTPVTKAFSHAAHRARAGGAAEPCAPCHRDTTQEREPGTVPAPSAATCAGAGCHDGDGAFSITERCTACHREAPQAVYRVARPKTRFSHVQHQQALAKVTCAGCHVERGATLAAPGHAACVACHQEDFGAAEPTTCGACHTATEPWRRLHADQLPADDTELGARLDHATHPQPCRRCHQLDTATRQLRLTRDHASCAGSACHLAQGGAPPTLTACERCHQLGLVDARVAQRRGAPWTVRRRFDHQPHLLDERGQPLDCARCHLDTAGPLERMPTPPKRTCEPCHDGARAFAVTGTACARCHGAAR